MVKTILIALVIALIIAGIVVGSMWSSLKSVIAQQRADDYVRQDSLKLDTNKDTFLYTKTEKREKPKQNPPAN